MVEKVLKLTGSIKLAVPLLATIVGILMWATVYEAQVGSPLVQAQVYKSVWFGGLMLLLVVNLAASTLVRYPWRTPRKIGFALTHLGLMVLIAGAAAVIHVSVEGMLLLRMDDGPRNQIQLSGDVLEVVTPSGQPQQAPVLIKPDGSVIPSMVGDLQLVGYSPATVTTATFTETGSVLNPAVHVQLYSDRMGQTLDRWLALAPDPYHQTTIGPAMLELVQAETEAQRQQFLTPPTATTAGTLGTLAVTIAPGTAPIEVDVEASLGQTIPLADVTLRVVDTWLDFRLDGANHPINASDQPRNPAVQLEVSQGDSSETWFVFAQADFPPIRSQITGEAIAVDIAYTLVPPPPIDGFRLVVAPDQSLSYLAWSSQGVKTGPLQIGEAVEPGWADFQITVLEFLSQARLHRQVVPVATAGNETRPALAVKTADGTAHWLPWGEPITLETATGQQFAAFSPQVLALPFTVTLDDFVVERNEGSESIAMWTSRVSLVDPTQGERVKRNVWMNHPTWFRGWKLAQASWNPGDLRQSTLQVKREPWWITSLTWLGSLLVISGIAVMFYGGALWQKGRAWLRPQSAPIVPDASAPIPESFPETFLETDLPDLERPMATPLIGKSL